MTTTPTSGAADLLDLIEAYAEARHRQGHSSYNGQTAAARQAVKDTLAAAFGGCPACGSKQCVSGECSRPTPDMMGIINGLADRAAQADSVLYDPKAKAAESVPAVEREQERIAFKDAHRHLELYEVPDAWGRPMFKHSHVEASWLGWIARASHGQAPADLSPTAGMNIAQRILHVGGRNNDAGYVEFGSIQAVEALVRQVLRDLPAPATADSVLEDAARYRWLRATTNYVTSKGERIDVRNHPDLWDAVIDAARKQGGAT